MGIEIARKIEQISSKAFIFLEIERSVLEVDRETEFPVTSLVSWFLDDVQRDVAIQTYQGKFKDAAKEGNWTTYITYKQASGRDVINFGKTPTHVTTAIRTTDPTKKEVVRKGQYNLAKIYMPTNLQDTFRNYERNTDRKSLKRKLQLPEKDINRFKAIQRKVVQEVAAKRTVDNSYLLMTYYHYRKPCIYDPLINFLHTKTKRKWLKQLYKNIILRKFVGNTVPNAKGIQIAKNSDRDTRIKQNNEVRAIRKFASTREGRTAHWTGFGHAPGLGMRRLGEVEDSLTPSTTPQQDPFYEAAIVCLVLALMVLILAIFWKRFSALITPRSGELIVRTKERNSLTRNDPPEIVIVN